MDVTRENMIDGQMRPNHVNDVRLLARFDDVAREDYVPEAYRQTAYADTTTPLGAGRGMFAPMTLARMLQNLSLQAGDRLLVVAGNTGYSAAIAAPLCLHVTVTESDPALLKQARANLKSFGNVEVREAAPGADSGAVYDAILLDAAGETLPPKLTAQLAEGGRLAAVTVGANGLLVASLFTRHGSSLFREDLFETKGPLHPALSHPAGFVF